MTSHSVMDPMPVALTKDLSPHCTFFGGFSIWNVSQLNHSQCGVICVHAPESSSMSLEIDKDLDSLSEIQA